VSDPFGRLRINSGSEESLLPLESYEPIRDSSLLGLDTDFVLLDHQRLRMTYSPYAVALRGGL